MGAISNFSSTIVPNCQIFLCEPTMNNGKDLFKEIILWAYKRQENGFFWVELEKAFSLTEEQMEWALKILRPNMPTGENLIDHLRYDERENADKFFITTKGIFIARGYIDEKQWYEKLIGQIFIGLLITIIAGYILFSLGWV